MFYEGYPCGIHVPQSCLEQIPLGYLDYIVPVNATEKPQSISIADERTGRLVSLSFSSAIVATRQDMNAGKCTFVIYSFLGNSPASEI